MPKMKTLLNGAMTLRSKTSGLVQQEFYVLLMRMCNLSRLMILAEVDSHQTCGDLSVIHVVHVIK